ncbi:CHAT domain-containing protein [Oscillatoria sp. FACHB-1406]|uniref:CHAT domain-containing protein n=1 Tax=Oscillatoria sp. FACHB-1406 TaxID=2692846 RepID=UPI0016856526|nr:CHAT domain-containing protein [Oscillatoria sp. FACHB-1406]MBD2580552.1 CHAT domain-containing protein [Oscillatoria sp. FACHB-1406]
MSTPGLSIALSRLTKVGSENFAIWVIQAPLTSAYLHEDCTWSDDLTQKWLAWQQMFSLQSELHLPIPEVGKPNLEMPALEVQGYSSRLMQDLGIALWQWLFNGSIQVSFAQSRGLALGQNQPLRLRLDIRDPNLIPLPWEIMQPEVGKQSVSLNQQLLFSRTTTDVDPLTPGAAREQLKILLVLGHNDAIAGEPMLELKLQDEAETLTRILAHPSALGLQSERRLSPPPQVDRLLKPTPAELIAALEVGDYNVFFYAGHGVPAPDGGLLFLGASETINGTELAQVLVRTRVTLAVFNACWGAQPDLAGSRAIARSSLAEVLIHHGVPAVLAMRDEIADREALSFIETLTEALAQRMPVDLAVAVARQHLLTLYKFNQPAWTLPILYMHPEFEGELLEPLDRGITELPTLQPDSLKGTQPVALLRSVEERSRVWPLRGGLMRVGRRQENDLVIPEQWVSQHHAEIICRETGFQPDSAKQYFLRDFSRYGTLVSGTGGWQRVHHQEIALYSGVQLKFGSLQGQALEFAIEMPN